MRRTERLREVRKMRFEETQPGGAGTKRRSRESGIREPEAGRRTILRRFVEDFMGKGLWRVAGEASDAGGGVDAGG